MTASRSGSRIGIAGAGLSGAVLARELAEGGRSVVVFEGRDHVGGHCHTIRDPATGVMLHVHGAHVFHTHRDDVWKYVNRFARFRPLAPRVKAVTAKGVFSLPINLLTLSQFFGKKFHPAEAKAFLDSVRDRTIDAPRNFEEQALSTMGRELYEVFFRDYTLKQWGVDPRNLPASVLKRLPIRFSYDDGYFDDPHQGVPEDGYTAMVESILDHPGIEVRLNEPLGSEAPTDFAHVFFTGPLDAWFEHRLGRLGYRTLRFERIDDTGDHQGGPLVTYCEKSVPFTRIVEHKHLAPWEHHERTVAMREYSSNTAPGDTPYYPLRLAEDDTLLRAYTDLANEQRGVTFLGRLGTYRYLDMHVVVHEAIELARGFLSHEHDVAPFPSFARSPVT